jgi:hypothetical protein
MMNTSFYIAFSKRHIEPEGQIEHTEDHSKEEYVPAAQAEHGVELFGEKDPNAQL